MAVKFFYPDEASRRNAELEFLLREHTRVVRSGDQDAVDAISQKIRDFKANGDER